MCVQLNRKAKGDLAELKIAADLRGRGYKIAFPYGEDWDYDLILCRPDGRLERVQVKHGRSDGRRIIVWASSHSLTKGKIKSTKRYTAVMIDWLAVWDCVLDRCFYLPAEELGAGMDAVTLRFAPTLNNQSVGIRFAERYSHI